MPPPTPHIIKVPHEVLALIADCIVQTSVLFSLTSLINFMLTSHAIYLRFQPTLLRLAAEHDAELVVDLPSPQNLDRYDPFRRSPYLLKAVRKDRRDAVKTMISFRPCISGHYLVPGCLCGTRPKHDDPDPVFLRGANVASRLSPLHVATYCGHTEMFGNLLELMPSVVIAWILIQRDSKWEQLHHGCTGLHVVAANGMQTLIKRLGDTGFRTHDTPNDDGIPGLHFATAFRFPDHESEITIRETLKPLLRGLLRIRVEPDRGDYRFPNDIRADMFKPQYPSDWPHLFRWSPFGPPIAELRSRRCIPEAVIDVLLEEGFELEKDLLERSEEWRRKMGICRVITRPKRPPLYELSESGGSRSVMRGVSP